MKLGTTHGPIAHSGFFSFILHLSSFILSLVSAKKFLNVWILCFSQSFISTAENNVAFTNHHHLTVNQTEALAFPLKHHLSFFVYYGVLGTEILDVVHLVGHKNRGHVFEIPQLHGKFTNRARCRRIEARCGLVEEDDLRIANQCPGNAHSSSHTT